MGQFVQNVKVYRGKPRIVDITDVYKSQQNESVCFVKKPYIQHWALLGLSPKFLTTTKNAWDSHPVNVSNVGLIGPNYVALADGDQGPLIVEHKNTIATMFHIDAKHSESIKVVENFIKHYIMLIQVTKHAL